MAAAPNSNWLDTSISIGAEEWVPLVILSDGSPFAEEVSDALASLADSTTSKLCIRTDVFDWRPAVANARSAEFRRSIHPERLWHGQPPWVVVLIDLDHDGTAERALACLGELLGPVEERLMVLPVLRSGMSVDDWSVRLKSQAFLPNPTFLLSAGQNPATDHDAIPKGIAGYITASWMSYASRKDGLVRDALGLVGEERFYTLGVGHDQPDWTYHAQSWAERVLRQLQNAWAGVAGSAERMDFPKAAELVRGLLPSRNYSANDDDRGMGPALVLGQRCVTIGFIETPTLPEFQTARDTSTVGLRVQRLKRFREILLLSERGAAERLVNQGVTRWRSAWRERVVAAMSPPSQPLGLFRWFRSMLDHGHEYLEQLSRLTVKPKEGQRSFEDNIQRCLKKDAAIPSLSSALLRYVLIAIGSAWTVWGTFFWAKRVHVWNDPGMRYVFLISVGALVVLLFLVLAQHAMAKLVAHRAESLTKRDLLEAFLNHVAVYVRSAFLDQVKDARREQALWTESLARLQAWCLEEGKKTPLMRATVLNRNPRFVGESLEAVFSERVGDMVREAHRDVVASALGESRWPLFEIQPWAEKAEAAAKRVTQSVIRGLRYDECVRAAGWGDSAKAYLMKDLIADARRPIFAGGSSHDVTITILGTRGWVSFVGGETVRFTGHSLSSMIAVAAIPLRLKEIEV